MHARDSTAGQGSAKCLQKFLGVRPDGEHGQFTDMALAAFLNVNHQSYPHVAMPAPAFATAVEWTENHRKPLLLKLQNFLLSHPQMTQAGGKFAVVENGELDAATVSALQTMMNCVNLGDDFAAAAEVYKSTLRAPSCRWLTPCVLISRHFTNSFRRRPPSPTQPSPRHGAWSCALWHRRLQLQLRQIFAAALVSAAATPVRVANLVQKSQLTTQPAAAAH
jgi:hypothetical protein